MRVWYITSSMMLKFIMSKMWGGEGGIVQVFMQGGVRLPTIYSLITNERVTQSEGQCSQFEGQVC